MFNKKIRLLVSLLFVLTIISACGSENGESSSNSNNEAENNNKERTLQHASGEVTIPANPEKIIAPYLEDSLVALGVTPAAQWSIGDDVIDYLQPQLEGVPKIAWDLPPEQVIKHNPDLVIFSSPSSLQNGSYEDYNKIAPTYVYKDEVSSDWRKQLTRMGEILNKQDKAEQALADFDKKVEEAKASLQTSIGDESVAFVWAKGDQFFVFENTRYVAETVYNEMGVTQPEFIKNLPKAEAQWNPISLEKLGQLDADHVFLIGSEGEAGFETLDNSSVWQSTPAVENNQVYTMNEPSHWTIDGVIAHSMSIDKIVETLTK
ncbi:iron-hydroxamate ABC transporter substrate-binding protein [Halobacillus shinanisalinarum]|uniref:Iron-hydroxamate ABC transporter substrate-binding protein n=1 Tax=Halobacillus shinanisalinarum TaxID=2932258 RepID=A0ABY4GUD7_9BACI|nr:iron-hydroxamate ABC transporter substrate-binding protein [Halobacillus shinanisalinarum]UOQ91639.1 iron-hydroxamate ABC transporter substrate-binding protein [Halobacillus shinanisalinarum]